MPLSFWCFLVIGQICWGRQSATPQASLLNPVLMQKDQWSFFVFFFCTLFETELAKVLCEVWKSILQSLVCLNCVHAWHPTVHVVMTCSWCGRRSLLKRRCVYCL
jgi:hypothetical protein